MSKIQRARILNLASVLGAALALTSFARPAYSQETPDNPQSTAQTPVAPKADSVAEPKDEQAPAASSDSTTQTNSEKKSDGPARKGRRQRHKPAQTTGSEPSKIVVRRGSTSEPTTQIVLGMPPEEAQRLREETVQLMSMTDSDLKLLASRELASNKQETIIQIRHYLDVARNALTEGDIQRAHTLAFKAHLLSEDLTKRP